MTRGRDAQLTQLVAAVVAAASAAEESGVVEPEPGPWWRHAGPAVLCKCGRSLYLHRIDTKAVTMEDGSCPGFRPGAVRWTEQRVVNVSVPDGVEL